MSAPQRFHAPTSHTSSRPRPKLVVRPRGYHHGRTRPEIIEKYRKSKWAGRALSLHVCRVASGPAQIACLLFIYYHTKGSPDAKERNAKWSPVLLPEDCAKECGLGVQIVREVFNESVASGFLARMSTRREDGGDFYRFQMDFDRIAEAPNAFTARESAFVPRNRCHRDRGEEKANFVDFTTTSAESRASLDAPNPLPLPAGKVAVAPKLAHPAREVEVSHSLPSDPALSCSLSDSGRLRIHLSPCSPAEPPAGTRVQPSAPSVAGPGLVERLARADELVALFDPVLREHGCELLSQNPEALRAACEVVGDLDHAAIVKFVEKRAKRAINSVFHVALILKSCIASGASPSGGCPHCGAPKERKTKLTGRCAICDGNRENATRILKDNDFTDAEIARIQGRP